MRCEAGEVLDNNQFIQIYQQTQRVAIEQLARFLLSDLKTGVPRHFRQL
jgi:hypothetical protein